MHQQLHYRPDIDGLRAIAVTGVVLFHAGFQVDGGYVGVDVFFVISGFLITSLILRALQKGTFTLEEFWVRRIRRIFPASVVMLAGVLLIASGILFPQNFESLAKSAISQSVFSANIYFFRNADYFNVSSDLLPLLHTWSLAVEEQFYFIYPLLLVGLWRFWPQRIFACLIVLFAASLALCIYGTAKHPDAAFYLLPFRAWELLAGGILAALPNKPKLSTTASEIGSWAGMLLIFYSMLFFDSNTIFPGISAGVPVLGSVLLIFANTHRLTSAGRMLAARPVVFVGLISYSWYLWHWPIMSFMRYSQFSFDRTSGVIAIVVSFVAAVLSWKFIETPFRRPSPDQKSSRVFMAALGSSCALLLIAGTIVFGNGLPNRFSQVAQHFIASTTLPTRLQTKNEKTELELPVLGKPGKVGENPSFLLWGDSHALFVAPVLRDLAEEAGVYGYIAARASTTPVLDAWSETTKGHAKRWNDSVLRFIERHAITNVVLAGRWTACVEPAPGGVMRAYLVDAKSDRVSQENALRVLESSLKNTISELKKRNVRIWLVKEVPLQECDVAKPIVVQTKWHLKEPENILGKWHGVSENESRVLQQRTAEVFSHLKDVFFVDSSHSIFDVNGLSIIAADGECYYFDDDHLSAAGAKHLLTDACRQIFTQIPASRTNTSNAEEQVARESSRRGL
jgi:peptidoglycan/LPS O-acetylase OafA/YrhL